MAQVSRHTLNPKVKQQIIDTFLDTISSIRNEKSAKSFLKSLLSPTEETMLSKRLSIAYMLKKGYTQRTITSVLKVSLPTVNKVNQILVSNTGEGYHIIVDHMLRQESIKAFFDKIEKHIALPPKGSWEAHYQNKRETKRKEQKAF